MPSTQLAVIEAGGYLALNHDVDELEAIIADNLGGQDVDEFDLPRIKVPAGGGKVWEIPTITGVDAQQILSGIVVHFKLTRAYWEPSADGGPPACKSDNGIMGIGSPGGECKTCPHAQYGTAFDDQGNPAAGQACNAKEIWFTLLPGSFLPVCIALPATSLKAARAYRIGKLGSVGMRLSSVVTSIALEQDKGGNGKAYSRIVPSVGGILSPEEAKAAQAYAARFRPLFDQAAEAMAVSDGTGFDVRDADVVPEAI
jgi:hypothetical protein